MNEDTYFLEQRKTHLEQLTRLLQFQSISALPEHHLDVQACAEFLRNHLQEIGFEHAELLPTKGNPVVYADWLHAPGQPTILVYGHYDVQPVDPIQLWSTPPFEPSIREGKIFARGTSDDKGQIFMHLKVFEYFLRTTGRIPVNVKFCIEGEEEIGSANLPAFLAEERARFQADLLVISDNPMLGPGQPSICYGLRGLAAMQIDVFGANSDLHSGLYGGAVPNAAHALVELLSTFHDKEGNITVNGYYDFVQSISPEEQHAFTSLGHDDVAYAKALGLTELHGEPGFSTLERTWIRPTLEINGIYSGFQGEGTKTVIPCEAHAKITCRLVPNQDPNYIFDCIEAHIQKHTPHGVKVHLTRMDSGKPYLTPFDHPAIRFASQAYEHAYGVPAAFTRMGGSIPIVEVFEHLLNTPVVMMGFGLPDENFHAPNEHFSLENFDKGLRVLCYYWNGIAHAMQHRG